MQNHYCVWHIFLFTEKFFNRILVDWLDTFYTNWKYLKQNFSCMVTDLVLSSYTYCKNLLPNSSCRVTGLELLWPRKVFLFLVKWMKIKFYRGYSEKSIDHVFYATFIGFFSVKCEWSEKKFLFGICLLGSLATRAYAVRNNICLINAC